MRKINLDDVIEFLGYKPYSSDFRKNIYKTEKGKIFIFEGVLFDNFDDLKHGHGIEPLDLIMYLKDCGRKEAQRILNKIKIHK
jgi:hypothetical protein